MNFTQYTQHNMLFAMLVLVLLTGCSRVIGFVSPKCDWDAVVCEYWNAGDDVQLTGEDREWAISQGRRAFDLPKRAIRSHDWSSHKDDFYREITYSTRSGDFVMRLGMLGPSFVIADLGEEMYEVHDSSFVEDFRQWQPSAE